jgi:chromosome transmission fidelity protein 1
MLLSDSQKSFQVGYISNFPDGLVVFFPSFSYLEQARTWFIKNGGMARLEAVKRVFVEPRKSGDLDGVLLEYSDAIESPANGRNGAMIMCVVSGKLSEGINFSDRLGRGVVMVGLPFANMASLELKEKLAFMQRKSGVVSKEYYENMCMRAVNQSIGRAIRHRGDYATVLLCDARFARVAEKLPGWIKDAGVGSGDAEEVIGRVGEFFEGFSGLVGKRS